MINIFPPTFSYPSNNFLLSISMGENTTPYLPETSSVVKRLRWGSTVTNGLKSIIVFAVENLLAVEVKLKEIT